MRSTLDQTLALIDGRDAEALRLCDEMLPRFSDPEGRVLQACVLARLGAGGAGDRAARAVRGRGVLRVAALPAHPWLAAVRDDPAFVRAIRRAAERTDALRRAFADAGGVTLLGLPR
jgi:hypothetical protein